MSDTKQRADAQGDERAAEMADAFDCFRAALRHCPTQDATDHVIGVLESRIRAALSRQPSAAASAGADFYDRFAKALNDKAEQAEAWRILFWSVAKELKCLPSIFVDGNEHVIKAARAALAAAKPEQPGLQIASGEDLRKIGGRYGLVCNAGESDHEFRARIHARINRPGATPL